MCQFNRPHVDAWTWSKQPIKTGEMDWYRKEVLILELQSLPLGLLGAIRMCAQIEFAVSHMRFSVCDTSVEDKYII